MLKESRFQKSRGKEIEELEMVVSEVSNKEDTAVVRRFEVEWQSITRIHQRIELDLEWLYYVVQINVTKLCTVWKEQLNWVYITMMICRHFCKQKMPEKLSFRKGQWHF